MKIQKTKIYLSILATVCAFQSYAAAGAIMRDGASDDVVLVSTYNKGTYNYLYDFVGLGDAETVCKLLDSGTPVNATAHQGWRTSIYLVAQDGGAGMCALLLGAGAWVNVVSPDGWTPLMVAACAGHADVCELFLAAGARVDARKPVLDGVQDGFTALETAIYEHTFTPPTAEVLIRAGADISRSGGYIRHALPELQTVVRDGAWARRVAALAVWNLRHPIHPDDKGKPW